MKDEMVERLDAQQRACTVDFAADRRRRTGRRVAGLHIPRRGVLKGTVGEPPADDTGRLAVCVDVGKVEAATSYIDEPIKYSLDVHAVRKATCTEYNTLNFVGRCHVATRIAS